VVYLDLDGFKAVNDLRGHQTGDRLLVLVAQLLEPDVHLVLELTESVLLEDDDQTLHALEGLKARGVRLAIDDFGTGFSSIAYLDRLPVDILKIDKSFVAKLPNPRSTSLVRGIIAMANSMGLTVVSEGVEDLQDVAELRELGCSVGQGFLFGRALDLPAARALIAQGPLNMTTADVGATKHFYAPATPA